MIKLIKEQIKIIKEKLNYKRKNKKNVENILNYKKKSVILKT